MIVDNFLSDYQGVRKHLDSVDYCGMVNPADDVFYPGVSLDIPDDVVAEVVEKIEIIEGRPIRVNALFLRLSVEDVQAPHQAHTDSIMGQRSMMLYLNRADDCCGGTSLVRHESGLYKNPANAEQEAIWMADTNNPEKWEVVQLCDMKPNRAYMFDADLMHRAEPVGGFGEDAKNGRLVMTAFYDYS